jgi:hypothetical protein
MKLILFQAFISVYTLFLTSCGPRPTLEDHPKTKGHLTEPFTEFDLPNYKAVVVKCDLGWLRLNILQYSHPKIEIHKTYQKYVHLEPKNDTLFVYIEKTPRSTEQLTINKTINLYIPHLAYLKSNSSKIVLKDYDEKNLEIANLNNSLRLYNCKIQNLKIDNNGISNVQLDMNNYFETLNVSMNEKSHYNSTALVLEKFTLKKKSLDNTSFKNISKNGFRWIRN